MRASVLMVLAAAALSACNPGGGGKALEPAYVPAHTARELMTVIMEPQAEVFWNSTGILFDEHGEHDLTPKTDEAWLTSQSAAATVAEMGNLLQTPLYALGRKPDWMEFSKSLTEVGLLAEQAVIARDTEAMMEISMTMYNICTACHRDYLPAPDTNAAPSQSQPR
jgi:hypothetical protein